MNKPLRLLGLLLLSIPSFASSPATIAGHFALQSGKPLTKAYVRLEPVGHDPLLQRVEIWMTTPSSADPLRDYEVEATKKLHVIIVSSDFSTFLHVHPQLGPDGVFRIEQRFPAAGLYYLYADATPEKLEQQAFRFDLPIGDTAEAKPRVFAPTGPEVEAGPYTVKLSPTRLHAGGEEMVDLQILESGKLAKDLHKYLGASAHAVFLNVKDLSYVHAHPMSMGSTAQPLSASIGTASRGSSSVAETAPASPEMMLHVALQEPGTYKLWLQFRGGEKLYVAPFVLTAN